MTHPQERQESMNLQEIREAVEYFEHYKQHPTEGMNWEEAERKRNVLVNCAQTVLDAVEKWPEKHTIDTMPKGIMTLEDIRNYRNAAIDACLAATAGRGVSEDTKKALAIQEAIRKCDVGSEVIIHNTDGSIYCILKKIAEEEER
jgi:hypothetical protein